MLIIDPSEKNLPPMSDTDASNRSVDGPQSSSGKGAIPNIPLSQDGPPPPYHQSSASSEPLSPTASVNHARSNYLEVTEVHRSLKGTWMIDSSLAIPSSVLQHQKWDESEGPRPNINLYSRHGSIKGEIKLCGPADDLVHIRAGSAHGSVSLKLYNGTNQKTHINLSSRQGSVSVYLPSEFRGHIECETSHGKVSFSDPVSQNLTQFSGHNGKHLAFLSPFPIPSGPEGSTAFDKAPDRLVANAVHGSVKVFYLDENRDNAQEEAQRPRRKGLFGRLFA